jgi:hypothetical protein
LLPNRLANAFFIVGGDTYFWTVKTESVRATINYINFNSLTNVALSTEVFSNTVVISGINTAVSYSTTNCLASVAYGSYSNNGTVSNGQTITLKMNSPTLFGTTAITSITIGTSTYYWTVSTRLDIYIDDIVFDLPITSLISTVVTSNSQSVSGVDIPVAFTTTSCSASIDGGELVTHGMLTNGCSVVLHMMSPDTYNTQKIGSITISGVSYYWNITTESVGYVAYDYVDVDYV